MFQRVQLAARDRFADLGALEPDRTGMSAADWETALGEYFDEHESLDDSPAARSPELLMIQRADRSWTVRQIVNDPAGHHDWAIVATVDLDASDAAGEPVIHTHSFAPAGRQPA